jgi:hypothetical protein
MLMATSAVCVALAGCSNVPRIVAGSIDQVGVGMSGGVQDQGGNMTVGYRGAKLAVVPVETNAGVPLPNLSVFAQLDFDAALKTSVGIEQVIAVGPAADIWALQKARLTKEEIALLLSARAARERQP